MLIWYLLILSYLCIVPSWTVVISGKIIGSSGKSSRVVVECYSLVFDTVTKEPVTIDPSTFFITTPYKIVRTTNGEYQFQLSTGYYSIFAFEDVNGNGALELNAPLGWYGSQLVAGNLAYINVQNETNINADITLKSPSTLHPGSAPNGGSLKILKGFNVLHLKGSAADRGYDHGYLLASPILDWFRFYILEQIMPPITYISNGRQFLTTVLTMDNNFIIEGNALLKGMKDSKINMTVPKLNKEFDLVDLFAMSAYIELGDYAQCSQFVVWGDQTADGNLIAARNMDGELDIRKITVSHLTIFAIEPSEKDQNKFVSIMWPGFLGTLTGFNELGLYGMMNTGVCPPGHQVKNAQPVSWIMREVLSTLTAASASPQTTEQLLVKYKSTGGGISTSGVIFVFARNNTGVTEPYGYVFEGDKYGGLIRVPDQVIPYGNVIMATNHNMVYGVNPFIPFDNFGIPAAFSSLDRYATGSFTLSAWQRVGLKVTVANMQDILQRVAHGQTEHSVIWTPHNRKFYVANSVYSPTMWDAPYLDWQEFQFEDVFK